jgi:hypothetical protein
MSAESRDLEYVWDFQVPGFEPETRRKTPRTFDSCNLQLIPFQPHTFDSIVTMMINRETSPFGLFSYIMCACCNDHKFWAWEPNQGLEEPKNCQMCAHCDAIICNRCATCHSKFSVETMNRKCKWCKKSVFPSKNRQFSPTNPIDVSDYSQYILAGSNLRDFSYWILLTKRRYDFSKIIWKFQLDTKGWRFFLISNLLLRQEHSKQYRFLLANMLLRQEHSKQYRFLLANMLLRTDEIQMVYHQPRQIAIMHNFAMVILRKLTHHNPVWNCTIKQYVNSKFAKKMQNMFGCFMKKN